MSYYFNLTQNVMEFIVETCYYQMQLSIDAHCSGVSAITEWTFNLGVIPISAIDFLTCSKDG